jgi:hypothetical protein
LPDDGLNGLHFFKEREMKREGEISGERRRFLRQTMTAAGGGVLVLLTAGTETDADSQSGNAGAGEAPVSQGYRVTDHIRSYYETLRS